MQKKTRSMFTMLSTGARVPAASGEISLEKHIFEPSEQSIISNGKSLAAVGMTSITRTSFSSPRVSKNQAKMGTLTWVPFSEDVQTLNCQLKNRDVSRDIV